MSPIGRIFVILNLFLAAAFLGWASFLLAERTEATELLAAEQAAHEATRTDLEGQISALRTERDAEATAKDGLRSENDSLKSQLATANSALQAEQQASSQLRASVTAIETTLGGFNQTIANLEAAKDAAVTEARDMERARDAANAERDAAQTAQRDAEEARRTAENQIADLERTLVATQQELSAKSTELAAVYEATGIPMDQVTPQPQIDGRVLQVDYNLDPGLLALNVGSDQGVTRGMTFQIFNGNNWKGEARVETVHGNMCSALILHMEEGDTIGQGDSATTRL